MRWHMGCSVQTRFAKGLCMIIIQAVVILLFVLGPALLGGGIVLMLHQRDQGASGWPGALLTLLAASVMAYGFWTITSQSA